jgi:hypothetical protein
MSTSTISPVIHPAMPLLRQSERILANMVAGGLDKLSFGSEELSDLILKLQGAGLEQIAAALQRAQATEDRTQRAGNILRAYTALRIVRCRLAEGVGTELKDAPLLSERSRLHIPALPAGVDPETLPGALALLGSAHQLHRLYAAERVVAHGDAALPGLIALAQQPKQDTAIVRTAVRCITQINSPATLDALLKFVDVLSVWREVNNGLLQHGQAVVAPLQQALSNPSTKGAWLMAKVLWRVGAMDALREAHKAASAPRAIQAETPEGEQSNNKNQGSPKKQRQTGPKPPKINIAFDAYHTSIGLTLEQAKKALDEYSTPTSRTILLVIALERGWITEDQLIAVLDNQQRNELRVSLRHVYGTAAHASVLEYYTRMQRSAIKRDDQLRAQVGVSVLDDSSLNLAGEDDEDDEDNE